MANGPINANVTLGVTVPSGVSSEVAAMGMLEFVMRHWSLSPQEESRIAEWFWLKFAGSQPKVS